MNSIESVSDWMLDRITRLDYYHPGMAGHYLRSSAERRQVVAAYCAVHEFDEGSAEETAQFLVTADHRSILLQAFGSIPSGLRGALSRAGSKDQDRDLYPLLHKLLLAPPHAAIAKTIKQLATVDVNILKVVRALPERLCTATMAVAVGDERTARDLKKLLPAMIRAGADEDSLLASLMSAKDQDAIDKTLYRWALKLDYPAGPIAASSNFTPIRNGEQLRGVGLKYRNCIRTYCAAILDGTASFAEMKHDDVGVLIEFQRKNGLWNLHEIYGFRNRMLRHEIRQAAEVFCERHGIVRRRPEADNDSEWSMLRRIGRFRQFAF